MAVYGGGGGDRGGWGGHSVANVAHAPRPKMSASSPTNRSPAQPFADVQAYFQSANHQLSPSASPRVYGSSGALRGPAADVISGSQSRPRGQTSLHSSNDLGLRGRLNEDDELARMGYGF
jgi:hypothetical protein